MEKQKKKEVQDSRKNRARMSYLIIIAAAVVLLIIIIAAAGRAGKNSAAASAETEMVQPEDIETGRAYLQGLEDRSYTTVIDELKQIHTQNLKEQRDARLAELEADEDSVWTLFQDYVIFGDSRAVGFYYYGFLPEDRVLAQGGATILTLEETIPDIVELSPSYVFISVGLNDVGLGAWPTPEEYATDYQATVEELMNQIPGVKVYIVSTLPAIDPAFESNSAWYNIPEYNDAVQAMCDNVENLYYVDCTELAEEHTDWYQPDGIHLQTYFYAPWAVQLIMAEYDSEIEDSDGSYSDTDSGDTASDTTESDTTETDTETDTTDITDTTDTADGTEAAA